MKMALPNFNEVAIPSDSEEEDDYQGKVCLAFFRRKFEKNEFFDIFCE